MRTCWHKFQDVTVLNGQLFVQL